MQKPSRLVSHVTGLVPRRRMVAVGVAGVVAVALLTVSRNPWNLIFLQDHPLPLAVSWLMVCVLLAVAVWLLIPTEHRPLIWAFVAVATVAVLCAGVAGAALGSFLFEKEELVNRAVSADGRYEVRVLYWVAVIDDAWDIVVQRRDGARFVAAYAGCLYSEAARYERIQSVESGRARIVTDEGVVEVQFDPDTMRITKRIPAELCPGYG
ncbi:hypothetical protein AB0368_35490 [Actinoplanes sp. NPDC051475]|uniref:hypothetical protein n=1 Tax=Actinoplanes sp. NPDC051475 TaxID=3157225 RepID=UPI00344D8CD6